MARRTIGLDAARIHVAIPAAAGGAPARRFWRHWMKRALATHESAMAIPHQPISAIDIEPEAG